ncbi:hypothetical protein PHAMO_10191 [Magnetospirillum molischianum DSM 120]|uniref:Uncharacterized protein n=1 Tax=Magnetospirillum molischianum DSM 120 TaxID=1150626 RepID=H8FN28_MAGML|nr:hypothetical protein PHAMO_10191 [Magnetospirillum molischianum DSM 120]
MWLWEFGITADTVSICDVSKAGAVLFDTSNMTLWSHFLYDFLLLTRGNPRYWRSLRSDNNHLTS